MKAAVASLFFVLSFATGVAAESAGPTTKANNPLPHSSVRGRIMELLQQDVAKIPAKPKEASAPFLTPDSAANDQPVAEGVLELEPITVTQKKPIELPLRPKLTLDNFFYGDGTMWESADKRFSFRAGRDALLKFNVKF